MDKQLQMIMIQFVGVFDSRLCVGFFVFVFFKALAAFDITFSRGRSLRRDRRGPFDGGISKGPSS